jgi:hypothetical protein
MFAPVGDAFWILIVEWFAGDQVEAVSETSRVWLEEVLPYCLGPFLLKSCPLLFEEFTVVK